MITEFDMRVYALVKEIPRGMVATYGDIARALGSRGYARAVGNSLHKNPFEGIVPCHRVVNSAGRLAPGFVFGGQNAQKALLEKEGIIVVDYSVDLEVYRYIF